MAFDPRQWTVAGYVARYGGPDNAIEVIKNDCLSGVDTKSGKPLHEIEKNLRKFVCSQYMFWIHHLVKESIKSLTTASAFGPLETLYHGCPEIARRVESKIAELEKNVEETEDGYVLKGMSPFEQNLYLNKIIREIYAEFLKIMRDKLGDYFYEVQDYFFDRCIKFGITPLPDKLPGPKITKETKETAKVIEELVKEKEKLEKELEKLKKEIESMINKILE